MIENLQAGDELLWRFPETGAVLVTSGTELVVPDNQVAVLLRGGRALAVFCPGRHVLAADTLPQEEQWAGGIEAEVYFVNTNEGVPIKWGVQVLYRAPTTPAQPEKALSYGILTVHIADPWQFIVHLVEDLGVREHKHVWGLVREMIAQALVPVLSELTWPLTDHPLFRQQVAEQLQPSLEAPLAEMGAVCKSLDIQGLRREGVSEVGSHDPGYPLPHQAPLSSAETDGQLVLDRGAWPSPGMIEAMMASTGQTTQPPGAPITTADVMDLAQAAAYLQMPEAEVLQLIEAGQIMARKIGSGYRMVRQKLDEWSAQRR